MSKPVAAGKAIRRLCPGTLCASPGGVWVVDQELPVLAFVDAGDLSVELVGSWFEESATRDWSVRREVCTAVAGAEDGCWVASPDAEGVIWLRHGRKSRFPMPAPVRALAYAKGACWAVLDQADPFGEPGPPPLWRLDSTGARSFGSEFGISDLIAAGDRIFGLGTASRGDSGRRIAILGISDGGQTEALAEYELRHGWKLRAHAGRTGPWIEIHSAGSEWPGGHWIEPLERAQDQWRPGHRLSLPPDAGPATLDGGDTAWSRVRADYGARDYDHIYAAIRRPLDGSAESQIVLPGQVSAGTGEGGRAWYISSQRLPLAPGTPQRDVLCLTYRPMAGIELNRVARWPGIDSFIPDIRPPQGVDPAAWAGSQCTRVEAELRRGWTDGMTGELRPFVNGAVFESVSLAGSYPATECVIRFRVQERKGVPFGRRIRLFDDLGAPRPCDYVALTLKEDIATGALPPPGRDIRTQDGVVWV
jgi:hypothetical protein